MPSGVGAGYPDWQRYSNWVGPALFTDTNISIGVAPTVRGPFHIPQWQSIMFAVSVGLNAIQMAIECAPSDIVGPLSVPRIFTLAPQTDCIFIVQSNTDRIVVNTNVNSGTSVCDISCHPCNLPEGVFETTFPSGIIQTGSITVGASSGTSVVLPFYFGEMDLHVGYSKAGFQTYRTYIRIDGAVIATVYEELASGLVTARRVLNPSCIVNLNFFNPDAAAQTVTYALTAPSP